jgi:hypothetical protein
MDTIEMAPRHFEARALIAAPRSKVFEFLDDHMRLVSHMSKSSWTMGGGRMVLDADSGEARAVGSKLRLSGRAFGIRLQVEEVIAERSPPQRKVWETAGAPRLMVIGNYKLGFELLPADDGTVARIFIDYDLPTGFFSRLLGIALAGMYAKWCVARMVDDTRIHFAAGSCESANAASQS